jgi:integrase
MARWRRARRPAHDDRLYAAAYTVQSPIDVLAMTWAQYDGQSIKLRRHKTRKTGKLLDVPCHPALKAHLDAARRTAMAIVAYRGSRFPTSASMSAFARVCGRAGTDAQARDLRRTAMTWMAPGATVPQIASVRGARSTRHSGSWRLTCRGWRTGRGGDHEDGRVQEGHESLTGVDHLRGKLTVESMVDRVPDVLQRVILRVLFYGREKPVSRPDRGSSKSDEARIQMKLCRVAARPSRGSPCARQLMRSSSLGSRVSS